MMAPDVPPRWRRLFTGSRFQGLSPWDRGKLEAHWMAGLRTRQIREHLALAIGRRRSLLGRSLPWRRRYLDGLIAGLTWELGRRGHGD